MPQLSLYIDEDTLQKLEMSAKINNISVSKFVTTALKEHFSKSWPEGFQNLFGSIKDDTFKEPDSLDFSLDTERESI